MTRMLLAVYLIMSPLWQAIPCCCGDAARPNGASSEAAMCPNCSVHPVADADGPPLHGPCHCVESPQFVAAIIDRSSDNSNAAGSAVDDSLRSGIGCDFGESKSKAISRIARDASLGLRAGLRSTSCASLQRFLL